MKINNYLSVFSDNPKFLIVGDIFLDTYIFGQSSRISPEKPVPVVKYENKEYFLGGAGNVAKILSSFSNRVYLLSQIGEDEKGKLVNKLLKKHKINSLLLKSKKFKTIEKKREIANNTQVLRIDDENLENNIIDSKKIKKILTKYIDKNTIVIFSDYNKGVLKNIEELINICRKNKITTIVDPKLKNLEKYKYATIIKPNEDEFNNYKLFLKSNKRKFQFRNLKCDHLIISMNKHGIKHINKNKEKHYKTDVKNIFDVTGAGDVLCALVGYLYSLNISLNEDAFKLINYICGLSISNSRHFNINKIHIIEYLKNNNLISKILDPKYVNIISKLYKKNNISIVFTNGCFDILHSGHLDLIKYANTVGDILILGLNSDISVKKNKGKLRPFIKYEDRSKLLSSLDYIDYIVPFDNKTPIEIIKNISPDVLLKGPDYKAEEIVGSRFMKKNGKKIIIFKSKKNISSTQIFKNIKKSVGKK